MRGERLMRAIAAAGRKSRLVRVLALTAGLGLAGCSDLDNSLFSDEGDLIIARLAKTSGIEAILAASKQSFAEVEQERLDCSVGEAAA